MSIYYDILNALKTKIVGVAGSIPVQIRKRPVFLVNDALPSIVISPDDTKGEVIEYEAFCKQVTYIYPVVVTLFEVGNRIQEIDTINTLDLREQIRNSIYQPTLAGQNTIYDTLLDLSGAYMQSEQRSNYELTNFRVQFKSLEERVN